MDLDGKIALVAEAADIGAERAQRFDQGAHGALAHLRHAVEAVDAAGGGGAKRGEKTGGGACEADEELDGGGVGMGGVGRKGPSLVGNADGEGGFVGGDGEAESA